MKNSDWTSTAYFISPQCIPFISDT